MLNGPEPDVVITDHSLGWSNGLKVVAACKERWPYCPIIMFTGTGGEEVAVEGMKAGLDDYIVKAPNQYYKLRAAVSRALRLAETRRRAAKLQLEREELLQRETQLRGQAEEASRLKDEFLATVSHELRTPLTPIAGWIRILRQRKLNDPLLERALEVVERNLEAQTHIIDDLLDVSRIITGKLKLSFQRVDLLQLAHAAVASIRPTADVKKINLEIRADSMNAAVKGDPARLQQVLWNLLSNAIKFTPEGGAVTLQLSPEGQHVMIAVMDNGEGIDPSFLPHMFERFTQADASTTRQHGGLGLGLAIVRHIVELYGGTVTAYSAGKAKGSRFEVRLPIDRTAAATPSSAPHVTADPELLKGATLLIVDDDNDTRELLQFSLNQMGAKTLTADNAPAALEKVASERPSLVISDIGMQGYDGLWLAERIKATYPDLPVIAVTAYAGAKDEMKAAKSGFDAFIAKPVEPARLALLIAERLGLAHK
ncbi:MAG TPA: response regulator [Planctomycetota bacterium]|nr:response regulator [Planctomycetota bacterium]